MTTNGGDVIAGILKAHGVPCLFTLCGGHISPILVAAKSKGIRVVDVRHEASAVFAADAFARLTGIPGVAAVTAGPGVTNTITALKNAQMAQSSVVLIGGAAATVIRGRGSLQDIDQIALLQSIVKVAATINRSCDIVPAFEHAFQVARSGVPGPVFIECPVDLLYGEELVRDWYGEKASEGTKGIKSKLFRLYLERHVDRMFACDFDTLEADPRAVPVLELPQDKIQKASRMLRKAQKPVLVIGSQAMLQQADIHKLPTSLEKLGLPVYLAGMARGLLGSSHRLHFRHNRSRFLKQADLVIVAGMPCDFRLGYGRSINTDAKFIAVNRSKADLKLNRRPNLAVLTDPFEFLCKLADAHEENKKNLTPWMKQLSEAEAARDREIVVQASEKTEFINPLSFFRKLDAFLEENSLIVADGGDFVATASYILHPRAPLSWLDPGVFGTLGVGGGFALGSVLSRPKSEIWLIYGDGAAGYSLQEIDTFVRHGLPVIIIVGNDASWAQIAREQVVVLEDDVGTVLRRTDYHTVAEGFGGKGFLLKTEDRILPVLQEARKTARKGIPALVNVMIGKTDFRKGSISM